MPTYEYECQACHHKFEEFQSITAKPTKKCPSCGKLKVHRLISAGAGFIFKGSGFYITDYRSEQYKNAEKADHAPTASPAEIKSDGKAETKPDTSKAETKTESKSETKSESKAESKSESKPAAAPTAPSKSESTSSSSKKSSSASKK